ncbi:hypothetical protein B0H11DRAFT_1907088 [Mycena galericulata]|nr:hypothetical protein B0H11DRAFT_1907088 [Mycena galericulata]
MQTQNLRDRDLCLPKYFMTSSRTRSPDAEPRPTAPRRAEAAMQQQKHHQVLLGLIERQACPRRLWMKLSTGTASVASARSRRFATSSSLVRTEGRDSDPAREEVEELEMYARAPVVRRCLAVAHAPNVPSIVQAEVFHQVNVNYSMRFRIFEVIPRGELGFKSKTPTCTTPVNPVWPRRPNVDPPSDFDGGRSSCATPRATSNLARVRAEIHFEMPISPIASRPPSTRPANNNLYAKSAFAFGNAHFQTCEAAGRKMGVHRRYCTTRSIHLRVLPFLRASWLRRCEAKDTRESASMRSEFATATPPSSCLPHLASSPVQWRTHQRGMHPFWLNLRARYPTIIPALKDHRELVSAPSSKSAARNIQPVPGWALASSRASGIPEAGGYALAHRLKPGDGIRRAREGEGLVLAPRALPRPSADSPISECREEQGGSGIVRSQEEGVPVRGTAREGASPTGEGGERGLGAAVGWRASIPTTRNTSASPPLTHLPPARTRPVGKNVHSEQCRGIDVEDFVVASPRTLILSTSVTRSSSQDP